MDDYFGSRLRELREAAGLTQKGLAEAAGVSQPAIGHWETGHRSPGLTEASKLAVALGVSIEDLISPPATINEPRGRGRPKKESPAANAMWSIPLTGYAPCGAPAPIPNGSDTFPMVSIPPVPGLGSSDGLFAVVAFGDSMTEAGILEDDLLVVRQNPNPPFGPAVMAIVTGGKATIKKRVHSDEYGGMPCLQSCDGKKTVTLEAGEVVEYAGDVVAVHRGISVPDLPKRKRRSGK